MLVLILQGLFLPGLFQRGAGMVRKWRGGGGGGKPALV